MTNITGIQVYDNMKTWQQKHEINDLAAQNLLNKKDKLGLSEEGILAEYFNQGSEIGFEYDFMEGKDPNNEQDYNAQLQKLGEGEVTAMDQNGDGEISLEEYLDSELKDIDEDDTIETIALGYAMAHFMFQMIDEGMGNSDSSGTLSADEFASLYKNLDQFTVTKVGEEYQGNLTGVFDGKIDILSSSEEFLWYLIDGTNNQENINQLYEMYLEALNQ